MSAEEQAPDLWDPDLECGAWIKASSVIGGPTHTHVCREPAGHGSACPHECTCGHHW